MDLHEMAQEHKMAKLIYNVVDFEERLSELAIGTDNVQQLMEFVRVLDAQNSNLQARLNHAAQMIGHSVIQDTLIEADHG